MSSIHHLYAVVQMVVVETSGIMVSASVLLCAIDSQVHL